MNALARRTMARPSATRWRSPPESRTTRDPAVLDAQQPRVSSTLR
jgi:hypothetical protein